MLTPGGVLSSPTALLELEVLMQPFKPFESSVQLIINKASGGRWRFLARIAATEPDPDDVISIEATLHRTSSVSFALPNTIVQYTPFKVRAWQCLVWLRFSLRACVRHARNTCRQIRVSLCLCRRTSRWMLGKSSLWRRGKACCRRRVPLPCSSSCRSRRMSTASRRSPSCSSR
jgi:hypothetical protein